MRNKTWITLAILSNLLVAGFFILQSAAPTEKPAERVEPKEQVLCSNLKSPACAQLKKTNSPGEMIVESLSRQFLSVSGLIR